MRTRGALLDVDGTLLDSNREHVSAWVQALREQSFDVTRERIRVLIGMGPDHLLPELGLSAERGAGKRAKERHAELFSEALSLLGPLPGARALVARLQEVNIARIVVTSSEKDELRRLLEVAQVADLIEGATAGGDGKATKPSPDLVHAAIARSGLPPDCLVMLGDTPYDIAAAREAGVPTVAVRSGGYRDEELEGAVAIYDDTADVLRHFADTPFSR